MSSIQPLVMNSYNELKKECNITSTNMLKVIDDFLIPYAAEKGKEAERIEKLFIRQERIINNLPSDWPSRAFPQYLAHTIFKEGGNIRVYIKHAALKRLTRDEMAFLEYQADHPWRFRFSTILSSPAEDFYLMEDVFSEEEFLLHSPAITSILKTRNAMLWFSLVLSNPHCCQTYGPVVPFNGFEPDDIFFFATEVNHLIEDEDDLIAEIDSNPLPFMLLISGSTLPVLFSKDHHVLHVMAEFDVDSLDTRKFKSSFKTAFSHGVYRLTLKRWGGPPHFSEAYYDENENTLLLSAMTDRGFTELTGAIRDCGLDIPPDADIRVSPAMVSTASEILGRKIDLLTYSGLFKEDVPVEKQEGLDRLNRLIELALPAINAGVQPDIRSIAEKAGYEPETAADILRQVTDQINKMGKSSKRK